MEKKPRTVDSRTLTVFPQYDVLETPDHYDLITFVRKQHEGVWYVIAVRTMIDYDSKISPDRRALYKKDLFEKFLTHVYKTILFHEIKPEMATPDSCGHILIDVDENQDSEEIRLGLRIRPLQQVKSKHIE